MLDTPKDLRFRSRYWDDLPAREAFKRFLIDIHGLDLGLWERRGFWDLDDYLPFSLFDGDRVVAHLCVFSLDAVVGGERRRLGQFSGVGTAPERRRQGLNRRLTERALEELGATHDGFFLFSAPDAVPFYRRCGFEPVMQKATVVEVEGEGAVGGARRLDLDDEDDLDLLVRLARERTPVSHVLAAHSVNLLMFHVLYDFADRVWYLPDLDVAVLFGVADGCLTLVDVIGPAMPSFDELHPRLPAGPHRRVRFGFVPDRLGVEDAPTLALGDDHAHVWPGLNLPAGEPVFPHTVHA